MFKKLYFLRFVILLGEFAIKFGDRGLFYIRLISQRQLKNRGAKFLLYFSFWSTEQIMIMLIGKIRNSCTYFTIS
jgi:hypothetical protein